MPEMNETERQIVAWLRDELVELAGNCEQARIDDTALHPHLACLAVCVERHLDTILAALDLADKASGYREALAAIEDGEGFADVIARQALQGDKNGQG